MAPPPAQGVVAVTGAAGYVGSWCVEGLLRRGYAVRACVRDAGDEKKVAFLRALPAFRDGKLTLHSCEMSVLGALDQVLQGCHALVHVAANIHTGGADQYEEIVRTTKHLLAGVEKSTSLMRIVYTSSDEAMLDANLMLLKANPVVNEQRYTDLTDKLATKEILGYSLAKIECERLLTEGGTQNGGQWDVIITNPGDIIGPILSAHHSSDTFQGTIAKIVCGEVQTQHPLGRPWMTVDVRDVAEAHIRLLEVLDVENGSRYLLEATDKVFLEDVGRHIMAAMPEAGIDAAVGVLKPHRRTLERDLIWGRVQMRNDKIRKQTGLHFRPLHESLRDTVSSLISVSRLKPKLRVQTSSL